MKVLRRHPDDKAIAALAVPALAALAADPIYSLVDTALVGHLGPAELGAVAVGSAAFTASFWLFSFLAYGVTPKVARAVGATDQRGASDIGVQALIVAVLAGVVVSVVGVALAGPIVRLLGGSGRVETLGESYLRIRILSSVFVLVALVGHGWLRGSHDTKTPMVVAIAGAVANALLAYLLIYPAGLGVQGAAWATVICQGAVAVTFVVTLARRFESPRWELDASTIKGLLTVGADLIVRTGALLAALTLATSLAARMGTVELAAWQIGMQIFLLLSLTMDSIAIAAQALVATHMGASDALSARRVGDRLLELGFGFGVLLGIVLWVSRGAVASAFTSDPEVERTAAQLIGWLALVQPIAAAAFTLDGILIGALDTRFLAYAMVGASLIFALTNLATYSAGWGTAGLALGAGTWLLARTATTHLRYRSRSLLFQDSDA